VVLNSQIGGFDLVGSKLVLIVADDQNARRAVEDAVATDVQVLVRVVPTGVEALAFTASIRPSLIVVHSAGFDDNLADLIRALKSSESTRRVPVVVIGAAAARAAAIQAGCDDYVETPFGSADLAPVLRGRL